jgi:glycosyltransferase involved in cell wall biosynthesis
VVVPTLNEGRNLPFVLSALKKINIDEILVIDGNSTDNTVEIAKDYGVSVVFQDGRGKGGAISQVFCNGYLDVDALVIIDADGSMMPEEIPNFVEKLQSGYDVVKGSRFLNGGHSEDMNFLRRLGNVFFSSLVRLVWAPEYTDLCYGYAIFTKESINRLAPVLKSQNFEIETEVFIKAKKLGLRVGEVPSVELARKFGKSNLKAFEDGMRILRTIINEIVSTPSS